MKDKNPAPIFAVRDQTMDAADLRDVAAEATRLALALRPESPDAVSFVAKLCAQFPHVAPALKTLQAIRGKLDGVKTRRQELIALTNKCTGVAASVIAKCQLVSKAASTLPTQVDVGPLEESVQALGLFVERSTRRGKLRTALNASRDKNDILRLHCLIGDLAGQMGLAEILTVCKGAVINPAGEGQGTEELIVAKQEMHQTAQPTPVDEGAGVPSRTPALEDWHVRRERVMSTVFKSFFRQGGPCVVGIVGGGGSGKTTAAAEIVRSAEVLEFFSDGVVWLSVDERASGRLPSLMLQLARMVHEDIGDAQGAGSPCVDSDDGASYVRDVVEGACGGQRGLRCLVVADNVWEPEVIAKLKETGMWILVTTRDEELVRGAGGRPVRVDRLSETGAELVLRRASELPDGASAPEAARDLADLCGRVAINLAFVGRWIALRGKKDDSMAWSDTADKIRTELQNLEPTQEDPARDASSERGGEGAIARSDPGDGVVGKGVGKNVPLRRSSSDATKVERRANRQKAILRAGFRELVVGVDDERMRWLYLALSVMPDDHEFTAEDATVLLRGKYRQSESDEQKAVRDVLAALKGWSILTVTGDKYRMHGVHSSFARKILMDGQEVRRSAVKQWVGFISSLDAVLFFDPFVLARLWSTVERIGGEDWRATWRPTRPYEKALAGLDNTDPLCRVCLEAVAKFRDAEGDWEGAYLLWRRLLAVEQRALEPDVMHPLWELVRGAEKMGKPQEAMEWRRHGYETLNLAMARTLSPLELEGGYGQTTAIVIRRLTQNVMRFGPSQGVEAEMMLRRALEIEVARRGPDDARVAAVLQRLGVCVRQAGRLQEAERLLKRVLEIEKAGPGTDDALAARTVFHLGVCTRLMGRLEEAEELAQQSLEIETARRVPDNVHVARTLHELGLCVRLSGRLVEARGHLGSALEMREAALGAKDPSVGHTLYELGICFRQEGAHAESEMFLRRALRVKKAAAAGSEGKALLAPTMFQLGVCILQGGWRLDEAESFLRQVLEVEEARLGPGDLSVARILFHLGVCLQRVGRREDAEAVLKRALKTLESKLGPRSEEVTTASEMLCLCAATE